jgi:hypothetical protein
VLLISSSRDGDALPRLVGVERAGDATSLSTATELSYAPLELMRHGNAASATLCTHDDILNACSNTYSYRPMDAYVLQPQVQLTSCNAVLLSLSHSTRQIRRSRFFLSQKLENGTALLSGSGTHMHQPTVEKVRQVERYY